ncbi:uncharacterized protein LDX57_000051 [Aspergillus melleus]|uniref:uncharacterized protein n=1 Tax=Aspergillus melleus TaxID=138277 RepID=UPI001E8E0891|nr:uncharacterized protein LDX57_000051 [Aspergillus melleus]KAH8422294.1 hypothetical protein LDX57_000051 [Aspergillus melleus]
MYALKQISLLTLALFSVASVAKTTTIGLETAEGSKPIQVPFDECHLIDEEEVHTVATTTFCRFFVGTVCNGRQTLLGPGDHSSADPVPIGSVFCQS